MIAIMVIIHIVLMIIITMTVLVFVIGLLLKSQELTSFKIHQILEDKEQVENIILDFSKAYDKVSHKSLLSEF